MAATDGTTSTDVSLSAVVVDSVRVLADGEELGAVLLRELPKSIPSRKLMKKLLRSRRVHVNGEACTEEHKVLPAGSLVEYIQEVKKRTHGAKMAAAGGVLPPDFEPVFAHLDEWCAVLVKPTRMAVQGDSTAHALHHAVGFALPPSDVPDALSRPRMVHRIDKMTGGLLVFARSQSANTLMSQAFATHEARKTYLALVAGKLEGEGVVDAPIQGKPARSRWVSLSCSPSATSGWVSTVRLHPETGRNHQLRRHLALSLGCPILGDPKYLSFEARAAEMDEMYLWASAISLPHPSRNEPLVVEVLEPEYFGRRRAAEEVAAQADPGAWQAAADRAAERQQRGAAGLLLSQQAAQGPEPEGETMSEIDDEQGGGDTSCELLREELY